MRGRRLQLSSCHTVPNRLSLRSFVPAAKRKNSLTHTQRGGLAETAEYGSLPLQCKRTHAGASQSIPVCDALSRTLSSRPRSPAYSGGGLLHCGVSTLGHTRCIERTNPVVQGLVRILHTQIAPTASCRHQSDKRASTFVRVNWPTNSQPDVR